MTAKFATILCAAATVLVCAPRASFADEKKTPLEEQMSTMNKSFKTLKKQLGDPSKKDSSLELIAAIKKAAHASKDLEPAKAKDVPEKDRAKFITDYKAAMDKLVTGFDTLEKAVKADNADGAKAALEDLTKQKGDGHKQFQKDEDK